MASPRHLEPRWRFPLEKIASVSGTTLSKTTFLVTVWLSKSTVQNLAAFQHVCFLSKTRQVLLQHKHNMTEILYTKPKMGSLHSSRNTAWHTVQKIAILWLNLRLFWHIKLTLNTNNMVPTTLQNSFCLTFTDKMNYFPGLIYVRVTPNKPIVGA